MSQEWGDGDPPEWVMWLLLLVCIILAVVFCGDDLLK